MFWIDFIISGNNISSTNAVNSNIIDKSPLARAIEVVMEIFEIFINHKKRSVSHLEPFLKIVLK